MSAAPLTAHGIVLPVEASQGIIQVHGAVPLDRRCSACEGMGLVVNPDSEAWWDAFEAWWRISGLDRSTALERFERVNRPVPAPDEWACGECEGVGWLLTPAGSAIMALVVRHSSPAGSVARG